MRAADGAAAPPAGAAACAALDPRRAAPDTVRLGLASALVGATLVGVAMCASAAALTLFVLWVTPPPAGARDVAAHMAWARAAPFSAQLGACAGWWLKRTHRCTAMRFVPHVCADSAAAALPPPPQTTWAGCPPPT
jgi:hypothetical protein